MNKENFYKSIVMNSINPFILFNKDEKLEDFNKEAEYLFNSVQPSELYELAIAHAPHSFGFEQKILNLKYAKDSYYAILVGYIDDEYLGLELYKQIDSTKRVTNTKNIELVNLYSLLEISKNTTLHSSLVLEEVYDTSLPEVKLNINNFLLTLNESFKLYENTKNLTIKVAIKIGEYEIIECKKYNIIIIELISDNKIAITNTLESQAYKSYINLTNIENSLKLEFPMIVE